VAIVKKVKLVFPEYITLNGTISRIIFHNPENGYVVLSVTIKQPEERFDDGLNDLSATDLKLTGHLEKKGFRVQF